jgi:hypothetical protein
MLPRAFIIAIVAVRVLSAQDESSALLERAREKILNSTRRMPKYTCLQTIDRTYYVPRPEKLSAHVMTEAPAPAPSCTGTNPGSPLLDAKDRLRMEVATAGEEEIHSWPGASRFDTRSIDQIVPYGPMSTGSFGGYLPDVFENPGTQLTFIGKKTYGSRDVFTYFFRVPLKASHLSIKGESGWKVTGFSGSLEINAATAELARLVIDTDQLPPDTRMCGSRTTLDYHFMLIGDGEFLIPLRSEFETFQPDGSQTDSVTAFSACHEYTAQSSLRFDDQDESANSVVKAPKVTVTLSPGIPVTLALIGSIDTRTAAAGDPVSAKITSAVRAPGSREILAPAGAIARGRILEMRHQYSSSQFLISIRFDTLEMQGAVSPLSIRLNRDVTSESRNPRGFRTRAEFSLPPPASTEPGGTFVLPARAGRSVLPVGFQSKWITVAH